MSHILGNLIAFAGLLRRAGLPVGTDQVLTLFEALPYVDLRSRDEVRAACETVLVRRREDLAAFDRIFNDLKFEAGAPAEPAEVEVSNETLVLRTYSDLDRVADRDFSALTDVEHAAVRAALVNLAWDVDRHRTRRWRRGRGTRIDLRRALARAIRTGGEIVALPTKVRRTRPRPIVLLCDVSGSMELYARTLLLFAHGMSRRRRHVEAFLFATRLTRISHELRASNPDAALAAVSRAVRDWSGGTRIGEALRTFHQRWRRRVLHGSSIVILISDGWDRGSPDALRDEMARLQRGCHRLIWLNPLIGTVDYAPLTRGLQAAMPFVDDFLPVRTLRDVRELALHLGSLHQYGRHRNVRVQRAAATGVGNDAGSRRDRVVHPRV